MTILDVETEFRIKFPQDYHSLPIPNEGGCIFALNNVWYVPGAEDLMYYINEGWESDGFPSNGVVIAYDGCGNYLFLLTKEESPDLESIVYSYNHETLEIIRVCNSPSDIMKVIHTKDKFKELLDLIK